MLLRIRSGLKYATLNRVTIENQRMVHWRGNSAENQDTNGSDHPLSHHSGDLNLSP